jgi:hypothetical protein
LKGLCSIREPKWREQLLKQAKWCDIRCFGMSVVATGIGNNPSQDQFLKKRCHHASHWKGLACLAKGTFLGLSPN